MANDIFGLNEDARPQLAGGFRFSGTHVMAFVSSTGTGSGSSAGSAYTGFLVQSLQANYQQNAIRLKGLNNKNQYVIVQAPEGSADVRSIIGNVSDTTEFITRFANPCSLKNNLHIGGPDPNCKAEVSDGKPLKGFDNLVMTGCLIGRFSVGIDISNLMYTAGVSMTFLSLVNSSNKLTTNVPELPT
jgi:hypothetical protein